MARFKITWLSWDGKNSKFLGYVYATCEAAARTQGRKQFGPFGNGQEIEAKPAA